MTSRVWQAEFGRPWEFCGRVDVALSRLCARMIHAHEVSRITEAELDGEHPGYQVLKSFDERGGPTCSDGNR